MRNGLVALGVMCAVTVAAEARQPRLPACGDGEAAGGEPVYCRQADDGQIVFEGNGHSFKGTADELAAYVKGVIAGKTVLFTYDVESRIADAYRVEYYGADGFSAQWMGQMVGLMALIAPKHTDGYASGHWSITDGELCHKVDSSAYGQGRMMISSPICHTLGDVLISIEDMAQGDPFDLRSGKAPHPFNPEDEPRWWYRAVGR